MSQDSIIMINESRTAYRQSHNEANAALASHFSGPTAPSSPLTYQFWYDTTAGLMKQWDGFAWQRLVPDSYTKTEADALLYGVGQVWQDETSDRALDTVYTNTTGRTITISVACVYTDDGLDLEVGGVVAAKHETGAGTGVHTATLQTVVPAGATYEAVRTAISSGGPTISYWAELKDA